MNTTFRRITLLIALTGLTVVGCNSGKTTVAPGVTTSDDKQKVTIETGDTKAEIATGDASVSLPDNFPKDVPIITGAKLTLASEIGGNTFNVAFESSKSLKEVLEYYKTEVEKNGWKIEQAIQIADGGTLQAKKGKQVLVVTFGKVDANTNGVIQVSESPE